MYLNKNKNKYNLNPRLNWVLILSVSILFCLGGIVFGFYQYLAYTKYNVLPENKEGGLLLDEVKLKDISNFINSKKLLNEQLKTHNGNLIDPSI